MVLKAMTDKSLENTFEKPPKTERTKPLSHQKAKKQLLTMQNMVHCLKISFFSTMRQKEIEAKMRLFLIALKVMEA